MGKVIGVVPSTEYHYLKEFVVEYDGDWWIGSSLVYRNPEGKRASSMQDVELDKTINATRNKMEAGLFEPIELTWAELLSEYAKRPTVAPKTSGGNFKSSLLMCAIITLICLVFFI